MSDDIEPGSPTDPGSRTTAVIATPAFRELVRGRNRFALTAGAVGFGAYLAVIVLSGFTPMLNGRAVGELSWTFVLTALMFPLVWLLCGLYVRRAARWDELAGRALAEAGVDVRAEPRP